MYPLRVQGTRSPGIELDVPEVRIVTRGGGGNRQSVAFQTDGERGIECPACRFKIESECDHEPGCPNGNWDRDDVIEHIRKEATHHVR